MWKEWPAQACMKQLVTFICLSVVCCLSSEKKNLKSHHIDPLKLQKGLKQKIAGNSQNSSEMKCLDFSLVHIEQFS